MLLNVITRCTRPDLLRTVKDSIFSNTHGIDVNWWVVFDTKDIKDIEAELLSDLQSPKINLIFSRGMDGDFGHFLINSIISRIQDGFICIIDDDNIIHPDFYRVIGESVNSNPRHRAFVYHQYVGGKDWSGLDIREGKPENMRVQGVDMAQFVLHRSLIGDRRLMLMEYKADGYFIENLYKDVPHEFFFIDQVLCYYNHLKQKGGGSPPRVLYIGDDSPELKSWRAGDFESDELRVTHRPDSSDIQDVLNTVDPDAIISTGDLSKIQNLSTLPADIRRRWIHLDGNISDTDKGSTGYNCAMHFILNGDKSDLISYFTPVYNTGDRLRLTYSSLKNQTHDNWEWVIVNDSTDGGKTIKIAESIAKDDHRVKIYDFRQKSRGIVGESKYRAAMLCKGEILAELDHDDFLTPNSTSDLYNASKKYPEVGFFYNDCAEMDDNWNSLARWPDGGFAFEYGRFRKEMFGDKEISVCVSNNINPKTIRHIVGVPNHIRAWRRSAYLSIGGHNRRMSIADDYEIMVRTFLSTKMMLIPKFGYIQFLHSSGSNTHVLSIGDIQRRVRTIAEHYNKRIYERFTELGLVDWAYLSNPAYPLATPSKFGEEENYANLIYTDEPELTIV